MNYNKEQILAVATAAAHAEGLCSIHLNDNGIKPDKDLMEDILDGFGIEYNPKPCTFVLNMPTRNPEALRDIVKTATKSMNSKDFDTCEPHNPLAYQSHLIKCK